MHPSDVKSRVAGFSAFRLAINSSREMLNKYVSVVVTSSRLETTWERAVEGRMTAARIVDHFILRTERKLESTSRCREEDSERTDSERKDAGQSSTRRERQEEGVPSPGLYLESIKHAPREYLATNPTPIQPYCYIPAQ